MGERPKCGAAEEDCDGEDDKVLNDDDDNSARVLAQLEAEANEQWCDIESGSSLLLNRNPRMLACSFVAAAVGGEAVLFFFFVFARAPRFNTMAAQRQQQRQQHPAHD